MVVEHVRQRRAEDAFAHARFIGNPVPSGRQYIGFCAAARATPHNALMPSALSPFFCGVAEFTGRRDLLAADPWIVGVIGPRDCGLFSLWIFPLLKPFCYGHISSSVTPPAVGSAGTRSEAPSRGIATLLMLASSATGATR